MGGRWLLVAVLVLAGAGLATTAAKANTGK
jgi:hypothetical protein